MHAGSRLAATVLLCGGALSLASESASQSVVAPAASLHQAHYTAWLAGYPSGAAVPVPRDGAQAEGEAARRPVGPTLLGHAELTVSALNGEETICSLRGMQLGIGEAHWDNGRRATIGIDERGSTVLHVPEGGTELRFDWSLSGERTPDGCSFRLHFPLATYQRLTLLLPEGLAPLLPGSVIEGPSATQQGDWVRWEVTLTARSGGVLHLFESAAVGRDSQILVTQSTDFDVSQAGVQWRARFDLHVLDEPVDELRFAVDGEVQIHEATLSQSGSVPGLFQGIRLSGASESAGEWSAVLPDSLSGSAQVVLRGTTPLVTEARWQLPRLRLADGIWQQGSVQLSVKDPLVLTTLDVQQGRQTVSEVTLRDGPAERHGFQLHDSDGRISIRLDLQGPDLQCSTDDRLEWSADSLMLTSYGEWSTQNSQLFRLYYRVPAGWDVVNVATEGQVNGGGAWQAQPALLRDWALIVTGEDENVLEVHLAQPLTSQSPVRTIAVARRAVRTETLRLSELLRFRARGTRSSGLLALAAVGPLDIEAEGLPGGLRLREDAPELEAWPKALGEPAGELVIQKQRRGGSTTLRLVPQRAKYKATVEVQAALLTDALVERVLLHCEPEESRPLRRVLAYFPGASGEPLEWRLRRRVAPDSPGSLPRRRLRPELHELWGLPSEGELWEIVLPQAYSNGVSLVAQRRRAAAESYEVALPALPEANEVAGQVAVATSDAARLELAHEELTLLAGPTAERPVGSWHLPSGFASDPTGVEAVRLREVGVWSYRSVRARLRLGLRRSRSVAPRFEATEHTEAMCPYALVETTAQPDACTETRISYWLISHGTKQVRLRLPPLVRLREARVNGRALDGENGDAEARELVVPLMRTDAMQTLTVRYRSTVPRGGAGWGAWLPCPVAQVAVKLPEVDFAVAAVQWGVLLPEGVRAVTVPASLAAQRASRGFSWSQRLFGPLGREAGAAPFDPWRHEHWESILGRTSALRPESLEAAVPLAAPAGSPAELRRLAAVPPGWQRLWLTTTVAPPELSLSVVSTASLRLMAVAALFLGLMAGLVVWRMMPRSRGVLIPFILALSWSVALALPEALSVVGADLALGVLLGVVLEGWRRRASSAVGDDLTGSTVRQLVITASVLAVAAIAIPRTLPAKTPARPLGRWPLAMAVGGSAAQESQEERPASGSGVRDGRGTVGRPDPRLLLGGRDEAEGRPAYILSGGQYDATLVDGHLKVRVVYNVLVFGSGDETPVRVRLPLDATRAGLLPEWQCQRDGESVRVSLVAEQGALEFRFPEPGEYELTLELAPLWDAPNAEQANRWLCSIPSLPQGRLRMKVPPGEGHVALIGAVGAVERSLNENGTMLEATLGSTSQVWLERRTAAHEPNVQVSEAFVLDLASPPVLHGWLRYQISGGAVEQVYLALETGMRAPAVSSDGKALEVRLLPVPRGSAPVAAVALGERRSGTIVLHVEMPIERFHGARPVGRLRVPKVFSRLVDRRDGLLAVRYSNRLIVRIAQNEDVSTVPQSRFAEMVSDWGSTQLRREADRVGLAVPWEPQLGQVEFAIRPAETAPLAEQTLSVEVRPDELGLEFRAVITPDQASGYQHRLRLSPAIEVEEVRVDPQTLLRRWQRSEGEPGELTLFLRESLATPHTIQLRGYVPGKVAGMRVPQVNLTGVRSDDHHVVLYADPAIGAGVEPLENLIQVPEFRGMPPQSTEGAPLRAVYRVVEPDYSATIQIGQTTEPRPKRFDAGAVDSDPLQTINAGSEDAGSATARGAASGTRPTLPSAEQGGGAVEPPSGAAGKTVVLLADAVYSLGASGDYVAEMTYWVASVPGGEILFRLTGRELELVATSVGGSSVRSSRDSSGLYRVRLPAGHLPETIVIRWRGKLDWPVALGDVLLPAPRLESAEVRQSVWKLQWPPEHRRWTPIEGAQTVDASTREAARLEALLQQAHLLVDHRPALPEPFLDDRLERLLNAFAALARQLPVASEGSERTGVATSHLRNLMDRARALAKSRLLNVSWSAPTDPWPAVPVGLGAVALESASHGKETATYAAVSSGERARLLKVRVVGYTWLSSLRTIAAIAALWLAALIARIVCRSGWFHAAPAARNVVLLAALGLAWWLWLSPSFAGLLIVLISPVLGWLLRRRRRLLTGAAFGASIP